MTIFYFLNNTKLFEYISNIIQASSFRFKLSVTLILQVHIVEDVLRCFLYSEDSFKLQEQSDKHEAKGA